MAVFLRGKTRLDCTLGARKRSIAHVINALARGPLDNDRLFWITLLDFILFFFFPNVSRIEWKCTIRVVAYCNRIRLLSCSTNSIWYTLQPRIARGSRSEQVGGNRVSETDRPVRIDESVSTKKVQYEVERARLFFSREIRSTLRVLYTYAYTIAVCVLEWERKNLKTEHRVYNE